MGPLSRRQTDGNILKNERAVTKKDDERNERPRTAQERFVQPSPSPPATSRPSSSSSRKRFPNRKVKRRQTEAIYHANNEQVENEEDEKRIRPKSSNAYIASQAITKSSDPVIVEGSEDPIEIDEEKCADELDKKDKKLTEEDFIRPVLPMHKEHTDIVASSNEKVSPKKDRPLTAPHKRDDISSKQNNNEHPPNEANSLEHIEQQQQSCEETRAPSRVRSARLPSSMMKVLHDQATKRPCSSPIRTDRIIQGRFSPLRSISALPNEPGPSTSDRAPSAPVGETSYNPSNAVVRETDDNDTHRRAESPLFPSTADNKKEGNRKDETDFDVDEYCAEDDALKGMFVLR